MIWSVSMFSIGSATIVEVKALIGSMKILHPFISRTYAKAIIAFGRAVLNFFGVRFSALGAENRTQMIVTYHAAAGRMGFKRGSPRKSSYTSPIASADTPGFPKIRSLSGRAARRARYRPAHLGSLDRSDARPSH